MLSFVKIYKYRSFQQIGFFKSKYFFSTAEKAKINYYQILEIDESATVADIKSAFHQKAKEYHPDAHSSNPSKIKESEEKFKTVVEAYKVLSDESKRKEYDEALKPKFSKYTHANGNSQSQSSSSGPRTRYTYEKFYGDEQFRDSYNAQQNYWQQGNSQHQNPYSPPPPKQTQEKPKGYFANMNYEALLIWGLGLVFVLRWVLFSWETENIYKRSTYSEVEHLNPDDAEEEGVHIEIKLPKDHSQPLTYNNIKGLTIEQLEEIDRMGYTLPATAKEKVMDYRETYKVYKKPKHTSYWNYNKMYEEKQETKKQEMQAQQELDQPEPPQVPKKKKKVVKETTKMANEEDDSYLYNEMIKNERPEVRNENSVGAADIRIPRMKANLYNLEKNR